MPLVAGVDSSTQSCKVVVRDAESGALVRSGSAPHPDGTEVDPAAWWAALRSAVDQAGGIDDVAAVSVAGQQHGMVCLTETGEVVRPALLWNDTRSAQAAADLTAELGGGQAWADAVGLVPVASFTVTKLRWLAEHEPANAVRTAAVCLPHDWLTWQLAGTPGLDALVTDRGDASGTGYWSPHTGQYRTDLLERAFGRDAVLPRVLGPAEQGAAVRGQRPCGDRAGRRRPVDRHLRGGVHRLDHPDRRPVGHRRRFRRRHRQLPAAGGHAERRPGAGRHGCLLYTSDAADE